MPADSFGDSRNAVVIGELYVWNSALPVPGIMFGASAGFTLSNGAVRSPDAAWISADRWNALPQAVRAPFAHIAPDFVIEIMSPSDRLTKAREKMEEYLTNGVRLGWLLDRATRTAYIYRPGVPAETVENPAVLRGDPELAGLTVNTARVFSDTI